MMRTAYTRRYDHEQAVAKGMTDAEYIAWIQPFRRRLWLGIWVILIGIAIVATGIIILIA